MPGEYCELNTGDSSQKWRFTKDQTLFAKADMLAQRFLRQDPHVCDRDYAHLDGYKSCVGSQGTTWWKPLDGGVNATIVYPILAQKLATYLNTSSLFRTYRRYPDASIRTRLGVMKHVENSKFGFLGVRPNSNQDYMEYEDFGFKMCR